MGKKNQKQQQDVGQGNPEQQGNPQAPEQQPAAPKGEERHKLYFQARQEAIKRLLSGDSSLGSSPEIRSAYEAILASCKAEIGLSAPAQANSGAKLSAFEKLKLARKAG